LLNPGAGAATIFTASARLCRTSTAHAVTIGALNSRMAAAARMPTAAHTAAAAQLKRDAIYCGDDS
jgi:hypothetical protein